MKSRKLFSWLLAFLLVFSNLGGSSVDAAEKVTKSFPSYSTLGMFLTNIISSVSNQSYPGKSLFSKVDIKGNTDVKVNGLAYIANGFSVGGNANFDITGDAYFKGAISTNGTKDIIEIGGDAHINDNVKMSGNTKMVIDGNLYVYGNHNFEYNGEKSVICVKGELYYTGNAPTYKTSACGSEGRGLYVESTPNPLETIPTLEVLEIIEDGDSQLRNYPDSNEFNIHTMRMKEFVAKNEELDGKYDMIFIGQGNYSTSGVSGKNHNTTNVMNDITNLKADQIINNFINKGQPVIFHQDSINKNKNSKLYKKFNPYLSQNKPNVLVYTNFTDLKKSINTFFSSSNYVSRPNLQLTSKPIDYLTNASKVYSKGETLNFNFNVGNFNQQLKANLYIDSDFNDRYDRSEIVKSVNLTSAAGNISYALPSGISGIRNWKLEVVDNANSLKDYDKGVIRFKDQLAHIKVLQITQSGTTSRLNDPSSSKVMTKSYLSKDGEYLIEIDNTEMSVFNKKIIELNDKTNNLKKYSYEGINGTYDMLIFGFADSYNNANISQQAAQAVVNFVNSGQSVMFTHDTIFETNNNWVDYFMNITGQKAPHTNLGHGAPNTSTSTKKVNDGLITQYPFTLANNIKIATTHNQYYTLDLEDPNVIPWYNITGSNRDSDDSWNHFYTYSKGNVTYSGTGHTNNAFPQEEQQLFVNTMYRAFQGSNHAPIITVITPQENDQVPSNQNIMLNFIAEDHDLNDRLLTATVKVDGTNIQLPNNGSIYSGESITVEIPHRLQKNGGFVNIEIEVTDQKGASAKKEFTVEVKKIKDLALPSREINGVSLVEFGTDVELNYKIESKDITIQSSQLANEEAVTEVKYEELFPANLEVKQVPTGFKKELKPNGQTLVTGKLNDIVFEKVGNVYKPKVAETTFKIKVSPKAGEQDSLKKFVLAEAKLSYKEFDSNVETTVKFNQLVIDAAYKLNSVSLGDTQTLYIGGESLALKPLLTVSPTKAHYQIVSWKVADPTIVAFDLDESGKQLESIHAKKNGETKVTVIIKDAFGTEKTGTLDVKVYTAVTGITVDPIELTLFVGEEKQVNVAISPANATNKNVIVVSSDSSVATFKDGKVKAEGVGTATITLTTQDGNYTATITVTVENNLTGLTFSGAPYTIKVGETLDLYNGKLQSIPANASKPNANAIQWSSSNRDVVTVDENGVVTGEKVGTGIVITAEYNGIKARAVINVGNGSGGSEDPGSPGETGGSDPGSEGIDYNNKW